MSLYTRITATQAAEVEKKSRPHDNRPGYYSSKTGSWLPISDEMEAFLILLPEDDRVTLVEKIKTKYLKAETEDDGVLSEYLENDYADVAQQYYGLADIEAQTGSFTKDLLSSMGSTTDVSALMYTAERGSNLTASQRDVEFFRMVTNRFISRNRGTKGSTDEEKKQAESWVNLLTEYGGQ